MTGLRIAILTSSYPRYLGDPSGHFVQTEARALVAAGHSVTVIAPGSNAAEAESFVEWLWDGGAFGWPGALNRLRERPWRALGASAFALRAARYLERTGPFDRVIAHFLVPCGWPIAPLGLQDTRSELEVVVHGSDARLFRRLPKRLRERVARTLTRQRARLRCVSESVHADLERAGLGQLLERARIEPCPIDLNGVPERSLARQSLGIAESEQLVVIVGRLVDEKRVTVALSALSLLPSVRTVVVGDGPERARLERAHPRVSFAGKRPRSETLAYIAAADALVSASRSEGAPTVIREARALGVPVVSPVVSDLVAWAAKDPGIFVV